MIDVAAAVSIETASGEMKRQGSRGPPWLIVVTEFGLRTTMHGFRFLVEPTKFLIRRFNDLSVFTSLQKERS